MLLLSNAFIPNTSASGKSIVSIPLDSPNSNSIEESFPERDFNIADHSDSGFLNPITIEKVGYMTSGTQSARTDTDPSVTYDLPLDDVHGWVASQAEVSITNLNRLYTVNGTFSDGIAGQDFLNDSMPISHYPYGWNATGFNPAGANQFQLSAYDDSGRTHIVAENQGVKVGPSGKKYDHIAGTEVVWYQLLDNRPYTQDFYLSLDYLLSRGPLGSAVTGEGRFFAMVDGTLIWNTSIPDIASRGTWYSVDNLPVSLTGAGSILNFSIGFTIDTTFSLNADDDNDGDGYADGISNTAYLTTWFDDISFVGQNSPEFEAVDLQFSAGASSTPIAGVAGIGSAVISNSTNWNTDPVHTSISSNASVSFDYQAKLLSHKYTDSNSATSASALGVNYQISPGTSPDLSLYTYLGSLGDYQNLNISIGHPYDWENATVWDPQSSDVTSQCLISPGTIIIPTALLLDNLGWWFITVQSPNYASSLVPEVYDSDGDTWSSETVFRSGNRSRAAISIGSGLETPDPLNQVNVTWMMPNGTIWHQESISGGISGDISSSELVFGPINTTAGEWQLRVLWTNGTEVASGEALFEIHHRASLEPDLSLIETQSGETEWAQVRYKDDENNQIIIEEAPGSFINGNWSASLISFNPNPSQKWWEAELDTSLLSAGDWTVVVSAHRDYFDNVSCQFTVRLLSVDNTLAIDVTNAEVDLGATHIVTFTYTDWLGSGIDSADVNVTIDGPDGGLSWTPPANDLGGGYYSIEFNTHISGNYRVFITASRTFYEQATDTLFLIVGDLGSDFVIVNATPGVTQYGDTYSLWVKYTNSSGDGLAGATVEAISVAPAVGLTVYPAVDESGGYYSFLLVPSLTATYEISFRANITNYKVGLGSFILTVNRASGSLSLNYSRQTISLDQSCIVTLNFTSDINGSIGGGYVAALFEPEGLIFSATEDLGSGWYRIVITATEKGTYPLTFIASYQNHLNQTAQFPLIVIEIPTRLRTSNGLYSADIDFMAHYTISLIFERTDADGNVSAASIQMTFISGSPIAWDVIQNGDFYEVTLHADTIEVRRVLITASKADYQTNSIEFLLNFVEIGTEVTGASLPYTLTLDNSFDFIYQYNITANHTGIVGAIVEATKIGSEWVAWTDLGNGQYRITVTPQNTGNYTVALTFNKDGFQSRTTSISFNVFPTDVSVKLLSSTQWYWQAPLRVTVNVTDSEFGTPISNALVQYIFIRTGVAVATGNLTESSPGTYSDVVTPGWVLGSGLKLRIVVEKAFHRQSTPFEVVITEALASDQVLPFSFIAYGPPIFAVVAIVGGAVATQRVRSRRRKAHMTRALAVKRRFDDVNNFIGIVILHKTSGLPIYSNVLKGGFEEGMISAFITAITHFRSEFDKADEDRTFEILPISDIIRAVPTRNLVCAFITVTSASMQMEEKMIEFAKAVGKLLDDDTELRPTQVNSSELAAVLEKYFEEAMDGFLLRYYKRGIAGSFPRKYQCLEGALAFTEAADCSRPTFIARTMTDHCKITEAEACLLVLEAIERELVVPCGNHEVVSFSRTRFDDDGLPDGPVTM